MHRVIERIVTDLMPFLRRLAVEGTADQARGARQAIWISYTGLTIAGDKQRFRDELRKRAIDQESKAGAESEKLFWRDVAEYASGSL
jgi:hypothetical protein